MELKGKIMEEATQARLREDIAKVEGMIGQRKLGRWKSGTMRNRKLVDTNAEDTDRLERTLASMKDQITDPED